MTKVNKRPTPMQIFKVQWPLAGDLSRVMIYNKSKSINQLLPVEWFDGLKPRNVHKIYIRAFIDTDGSLAVDGIADEQEW